MKKPAFMNDYQIQIGTDRFYNTETAYDVDQLIKDYQTGSKTDEVLKKEIVKVDNTGATCNDKKSKCQRLTKKGLKEVEKARNYW